MSSGSKKQTIGYRYSLGEHLALVHGPVDKCTRLRWDERVAWEGSSTGGRIDVDAGDLFGGDKREGGVSGAIDFETGAPAQGRNSYLQAKLGTEIPAFRGVASLVFRQLYLGNNPYLKPMDVRLQRIHVRQDGVEQWYDEKAEIPTSCGYPVQTTGWMVNRLNSLSSVIESPDGVDWSANDYVLLAPSGCNFFRLFPWAGIVYGGAFNSQGYNISTDGGESFVARVTGVSVSSGGGKIEWDGAYYWMCGGVQPLLRSSNLIDWTNPSSSNSSRSNAVHCANGVVYVASIYNATINKSSNLGVTWESAGLFVDAAYSGGVTGTILWEGNATPKKDSAYTLLCTQAGSGGNYVRRIHKINSDVSLQTLVLEVPDYHGASNPGWAADGLAHDGASGWVAALTTDIWYSRNDGATWTKSANSFFDIWSVVSDGESFLLTHSTGVARSTNGGETWTSYTLTEPGPYFGALSKASTSFVQNGDMNPAHIIRECLTDPDWGMGYPEDAIDDASFTAAADQLFAEQMGISILWDRQSAILDFVDEIVRHIDAALFVSRTTGKFVLKLIRGGYNEGTLLVLDESNVERVEKFSRPTFGELINTVTINYEPCS